MGAINAKGTIKANKSGMVRMSVKAVSYTHLSLQLRGIELPDDLKDEVFLIIGERRNIEVKKADDR